MSDSSVPFLETIEKKIIEEGREIEEVTGISSPKKTKSALPSTAVRVYPVKVSEKESLERPPTAVKEILKDSSKVSAAPSSKEEVVPPIFKKEVADAPVFLSEKKVTNVPILKSSVADAPVFLPEKNVIPAVMVRGDETDRASGKGSSASSKSSNSHLSRRSVLQKVWADPGRRVAYPGSWSLSSYSEWFRSI